MFPFSYRGGLEPDQAFLLLGSDGNLFLALGRLPTFEFVGLRNSAPLAEEETVEEEESELDFGMI